MQWSSSEFSGWVIPYSGIPPQASASHGETADACHLMLSTESTPLPRHVAHMVSSSVLMKPLGSETKVRGLKFGALRQKTQHINIPR